MRSLFSNEGLNSGAHCESTGLTHWTTRAFPELGRLDYFEHRSDGPSGGDVLGVACGAARRQAGEACWKLVAAQRRTAAQTRMAPVQVVTRFWLLKLF